MLRTTFRRLSAYIPRDQRAVNPHSLENAPELTKMGQNLVMGSYVRDKVDETINSKQDERDKEELRRGAMENKEETSNLGKHPTGKKVIKGDRPEDEHRREKSKAEWKNDGTKLYD